MATWQTTEDALHSPNPPKEPPKTIGTPTQIFTTACSSPIGLSLCSWNANGLLRKYAELRIFIEKHSPDVLLIQETHLRPSHTTSISQTTYAIEMTESQKERVPQVEL
ncbi:hypothetical protein TNCV_4792061 [Trichonephila clavipes]|nr:hypothetical protein TNCV_4792061 [Trichonephila clavipes]